MFRSLTAVTSPYFLEMWSSVTPAIFRFSFPPSLGRCKGVLTRATIDPSVASITRGALAGRGLPPGAGGRRGRSAALARPLRMGSPRYAQRAAGVVFVARYMQLAQRTSADFQAARPPYRALCVTPNRTANMTAPPRYLQ